MDTIFSSKRTIYNYSLLDPGRKSLTSQIAGYSETTRDNPYSHNSPNRRVLQPLCDFKKFPGHWIKGESKAWTIFWTIWTSTLRDLTRCHTSISCTLLSIYMTSELNIKCLWQHPATSNHLEITKTKWSEISDPMVITAHSLRQLQPGNWKIPIKPGTEEQLISSQPHNSLQNFLTSKTLIL